MRSTIKIRNQGCSLLNFNPKTSCKHIFFIKSLFATIRGISARRPAFQLSGHFNVYHTLLPFFLVVDMRQNRLNTTCFMFANFFQIYSFFSTRERPTTSQTPTLALVTLFSPHIHIYINHCFVGPD